MNPDVTRENSSGEQECLAQVLAVRAVVSALAVFAGKPESAVGLLVVRELCGENPAATQWLTALVDHFIDDAEAVALAQVAMEVDIAAENVGHLGGNPIRNSCSIRCAEQ